MKKITVGLISGSRADYGLLKHSINKLNLSDKINFKFIVTGNHFSKKFGFSISKILSDKIKINHKIKIDVTNNNDLGVNLQVSDGIKKFSHLFQKIKFNIIIVLGDRYEIFSAAVAAMIMKIPIAHIHGGEVTMGSMDDKIRHSISKISNIHFVATKNSQKRLISMGENPGHVYYVGAPGIENLVKTKKITKKELLINLNLTKFSRFYLVCYHPNSTTDVSNSLLEINILFHSLTKFPNKNFIFTSPNSDANGKKIINYLEINCSKYHNIEFIKNMGSLNYINSLRHCDAIIGNSSSGIIEAPYLKKWTINLGNRQDGREMSGSIINLNFEKKKIINILKKIDKMKMKKKMKLFYKFKQTSVLVNKIIEKKKFNINKKFYDI